MSQSDSLHLSECNLVLCAVVKLGCSRGSVATLQVARDRLAGCSSWPLRFAVYSSDGNLSRRSSCWQWGDTCAFPFRTAMSRSCSPSGACAPITSPSGGGSSAMARKWTNVCVGDSNQPTTVGGWMRPTSGLRASGCIYTGPWTPPVRRSTSFCRLDATKRPLSAGSPGHQTPGARKPTFSFILGSLAYDRRLRSDSYDPQRPSVLQCGDRSTASLHSRSVRGDKLNFRSSTPTEGRAFICSCLSIVSLMLLFAAGVYPNMVFSTPDHANDLNIYNGSSTAKSLQFILYVAMIGVPVVLTYTATIYYVFRGKVVLTEESY